MYTGALTLCAAIALFCGLALIMDCVLDRLVFEPMEEDWSNLGEE